MFENRKTGPVYTKCLDDANASGNPTSVDNEAHLKELLIQVFLFI